MKRENCVGVEIGTKGDGGRFSKWMIIVGAGERYSRCMPDELKYIADMPSS